MSKIKEEKIKKLRTEKALLKHQGFLINNLKKEWEEVERFARRDEFKRELKRKSKEAAVFVAKSVLILLLIGGALAVAAAAPNVLAAFGRRRSHKRYFEKKNFKTAVRSLNKNGFVKPAMESGGYSLYLTEKGRRKALEISFQDLKVKSHEKWDGRWRVVIYDVPLKNKWARDGFRDKLKLLGFYQLQKSAFVFPYPCGEEIDFLREFYGLKNDVRMMETESMGDENKQLLDYFGVSVKAGY